MAIINGSAGGDTLNGTGQADQIFGLAGNDTLVGLAGDDVLEGGAGADELFGSDGLDTASFRGSGRAVHIDFDTFTFSGGHADGDNLYSIEAVIGSAFDDTMIASEAQGCVFRGEGGRDTLAGRGQADGLYGGNGDDRLDGGDGKDTLVGWAGDDVLRGGAGIDTVAFGYVSSGVVADLASGTATGDANFGSDRLFEFENIIGTSLADRLAGNGGANALTGGFGADVLIGRGGADRFDYESRYDSNPKAPDLIRDFSRAQGDRIDLLAIDANEQVDGNQSFQFVGQAPSTVAGQVRIFQEGGNTVIEADVSDAIAGAELRIEIGPLLALRASDFIL